jgi:hypothetical protein
MKFCIGDKVKVKSLVEISKLEDRGIPYGFTKEMRHWCGHWVTISEVFKNYDGNKEGAYHIIEESYLWHEIMFEDYLPEEMILHRIKLEIGL